MKITIPENVLYNGRRNDVSSELNQKVLKLIHWKQSKAVP